MSQIRHSNFVYLCRMCHREFELPGVEDQPGDDSNAIDAIYATIGNAEGERVAKMVTAHDCNAWQIGIGDLIGIREAK